MDIVLLDDRGRLFLSPRIEEWEPLSEHGISVAQTKLVKRALDYDTLIRPSEQAISGARALVIVPDAALENIAFAILGGHVVAMRSIDPYWNAAKRSRRDSRSSVITRPATRPAACCRWPSTS